MEIDMDRIGQVIEQMATVLDHARGIVRRDPTASALRLRTNGRAVEIPPMLMVAGVAMLVVAGVFFGGREPLSARSEPMLSDASRFQPVGTR